MADLGHFGLVIAVVAAALLGALLVNRVSARIRVPAPAILLLGAALASDLVPRLSHIPVLTVQRAVTLALIPILFEGGLHLGWRRFRGAAGAVVWIGVAGTFVTAGALALLAYGLVGLDGRSALLLGTALAPTDPAVVFAVLGKREFTGRAGVILEGESGANDPVGIALMVALLAGTAGTGVLVFAEQMLIGTAVGVAGAYGLRWFMRRVPLPAVGLYPLRTLAGAAAIYGVAAVAHGSGFLAVFLAGILIGDGAAPFSAEIGRFHAALASLGEIVAFILLGLTVRLSTVVSHGAWLAGLLLAVLLAVVVRPALVGLISLPIRLRPGERAFVLWAGLRGAVPILLGTFIIAAGVPDANRLYAIIFVVVAFSVTVQGGLIPTAARLLRVPMRLASPTPLAVPGQDGGGEQA